MPNLIDHLVFRAKLEPKSIALQAMDRQITFDQLLHLVRRIAHKLRRCGVKPGQVVVTSISEKYFAWIVTLALFHEAAISCSNQGHAPIGPSFEYDWMITDRVSDQFPAEKTIRIDSHWLSDAQNHSHQIEQIDTQTAESPVRIIFTSGTTGQRKVVVQNLQQIISIIKNQVLYYGSYRTLDLLNMSTSGGFIHAANRLITGNCLFCLKPKASVVDFLERYSIESVSGSPQQLGALINELLKRPEKTVTLKMVRYLGGSASPTLLRHIETMLTSNIINVYGSTEAGGVCIYRPTPQIQFAVAGYPMLGVEVQIVDEFHAPLPRAAEGFVRIKSPYMVQEYHANAQASAKSFRAGWFYPGDRGLLMNDGLLVLSGRDSELINRGGVKIDSTSIEQFLTDYPGVEDTAVFALENRIGTQEVAAAIVATANFDKSTLHQDLLKKFGKARSPSMVFKVNMIPRNEMGKIMRAEMSKKFTEIVRKQEPGSSAGKQEK